MLKLYDYLREVMDLKDALCNLEVGLLEKEPADDLRRYLIRVDKRWKVLRMRIERAISKFSS